MNIKVKDRKNIVAFGCLNLSTPFVYGGDLYVKIGNATCCKVGRPEGSSIPFNSNCPVALIETIEVTPA